MEHEKTILIMRHAKSSWEDSSLKDFDRPLNKRGRRDAPAMGRYLAGLDLIPDNIVCSPAKRAKETVELLSEAIGGDVPAVNFDEALYYDGVEAYMEAIRRAPQESGIVLLAGHNPTIEQAVAKLSAGNTRLQKITTANIACFYSSASRWENVSKLNTTFKWLTGPKDIQD